MGNTGSERWFGHDKEKVTALAMAEAKGIHDAGILTVGKHYPSGNNVHNVDSHMAESLSAKKVPFEMHIYPRGPHGVALGNWLTSRGNPGYDDAAVERWVDDSVYWMKHL